MSDDQPTEITIEAIDRFMENYFNSEIKVIKCSWCNKSNYVREVGPNYICYDCEKVEREAKRPLVFTSPVSDAYFSITEEPNE